MARELTLVDARLDNLSSVRRALVQVGASVHVTSDPDEIAKASALILPGQGTLCEATDALVKGPIGEAIKLVIQRGDPFLGISVGMQLLFDCSHENPKHEGFHVMKGQIHSFPRDMSVKENGQPRRLKLPHCGWNDVSPAGDHYYFSHRHYVQASDASDLLWSCHYGSVNFAAAVRRDNIYGCQFHPEKSQKMGLRFLRTFVLGSRS